MSLGPETRRWRRLGLRREILILLPVALLLLVVLSTFTLFSYRSALSLLADERRDEAARLARAVADQLAARDGVPTPGELRRLAPAARAVALVDPAGSAVVVVGDLPTSNLLAAAGVQPAHRRIDRPVGVGPNELLPEAVAGFAPLAGPAGRRYVRVDLAAGVLAGQHRALQVLSVVVLAVNSMLILLVLFFLRHLLAPYETLLARAQQVGGLAGGAEGAKDEMDFLLATFERALAALAIREGRRAEDDIAALERTLSASLQSGLVLLDRDGNVLALNAVGAALLGAEAPVPGTPLAEVLAHQPELLELLTSSVAEGRAPQRQECAVRCDGEARTVGLTLHPLRRDDGGVRGYLALFADLTEVQRRAGEARLAESLARLGEMAGGVAHELRNSLATLRGYLTLIERRPHEESIADYLDEIRREADHLERVLEDFLAFARPGTARVQEFPLAPLLMRAAADPALAGIEVRLGGTGSRLTGAGSRLTGTGSRLTGAESRLTGDAAAAGLVLKGDPQLLERAVRNLLHNAAEAEREAGRCGPIEITVDASGDGIEVAIEDRGPGLPEEVRERLFHPFATGRRGGVGLGLALAHRIVVLHGGRIRLEDRPGGGTRALLVLPSDILVTASNSPEAA